MDCETSLHFTVGRLFVGLFFLLLNKHKRGISARLPTLTGLDVLSVGIVHNWKPEEKPIGQAVVLNDGQVLLLSHEPSQGAEASVAD